MWNMNKSVCTTAMKWGIDHEMDAVSEFEKENGRTTKVGSL